MWIGWKRHGWTEKQSTRWQEYLVEVNEEVTGDLFTPVILESKFEGYLSKRHNWICWERKDYWEICSLDEGASVRGSHMNNNLKMVMPCRERNKTESTESNIKDAENKNDQCLIKFPMCYIWWPGDGCRKTTTKLHTWKLTGLHFHINLFISSFHK